MTVTKERWRELCKLAARERDPEKLVKLCDEINSILQHASRTSPQAPNEVADAADRQP
jgi:Asp-tRNA(Asn)/Glu-tRNA(Gln) amidotransferase C subunit